MGGASATCEVTVSKYPQEIIWSQEFDEVSIETEIELTAETTSGLAVTYSLTKGENLATIDDKKLLLKNEGEIEITASQDGNKKYLPAESVVKSIVIVSTGVGSLMIDADKVIAVYNTTGTLVYRGCLSDMHIKLKGIYIIKSKDKTFKSIF